jgi:amino-acid N-acetyltransferase
MSNAQRTLEGRAISLRSAAISDLPAVRRLLTELALPTAGLNDWWSHFTVAESDGAVVGVAGLERYPDGVLLRSVAVHPAWRSSGLGQALVETVLLYAARAGDQDAYLLTTTAERYFPRLGFAVIPRDSAPASVQQSVEFREACPASAVVMHRTLSAR